ncbi:MAG: O-antigen ligase family protein [Patescibacteria group bacterium]
MYRKILISLFSALFLFTPLILTSFTSEMFEIPKMLFVYFITGLIVAAYIIYIIIHKKRIQFGAGHFLLLLFVVSQLLSWAFSIDKHTSMFGYYGRFNGGFLSTLVFAALMFISSQIFDKRIFSILINVSIVASIFVLLWGLPGRFFGVDMSCVYFRWDFSTSCWTNEFRPAERMFSTLGQPNWLGAFFSLHFFYGLYMAWQRYSEKLQKQKLILYAYIAYSILMLWSVTLTGSRSSLLGILLPTVVELLIYLYRKLNKRIFIGTVTIFAVLVLAITTYYAISIYQQNDPNGITHSGKIRLIVWEGAIKLATKYPLFGTGPETFAYSYYLTRPDAHNYTSEKDFIYNKAHNEVLNMLATTGFVGLTAYLLLFGFVVYSLLRMYLTQRIVAYMLISIFTLNFFGFSTSTSQIALYTLMGYGFYEIYSNKMSWSKKLEVQKLNKFILSSISSIVVLSLLLYLAFLRNYLVGDILYAQSQAYFESSSPVKAITNCMDAVNTKFEHIYADRCASMSAATASLLKDAESEELVDYRKSLISLANTFSAIALSSSPQNPIYIRSRIKVINILMTLDKSKDYKQEKIKLNALYRKLAPTDHQKFD